MDRGLRVGLDHATNSLTTQGQISYHLDKNLIHKHNPVAASSSRKRNPNKASHLQTTSTDNHPLHHSPSQPPQSCLKHTSAKGKTTLFPKPTSKLILLPQTKQRLPLRPLRQSLRPAQRHRRHLRQCPRPARHRQHLRVLLQHDHEHQRQRASAGRHGEPGQQSGRVEIGRDNCRDGRGALVDFELVLVRKRERRDVYILRMSLWRIRGFGEAILQGADDMVSSMALWSFTLFTNRRFTITEPGVALLYGLSLRCSIGLKQITHASF